MVPTVWFKPLAIINTDNTQTIGLTQRAPRKRKRESENPKATAIARLVIHILNENTGSGNLGTRRAVP